MKVTFLTLVAAAVFALAAPTATLQNDGDYCDKNDHRITDDYTVYNNLWGQDKAWHGSQCTGIDGLNGATVQWHTKWTWAGKYVYHSLSSLIRLTPPAATR
jgi:xyloglucan-specific endo-beta-1,4-glucanase